MEHKNCRRYEGWLIYISTILSIVVLSACNTGSADTKDYYADGVTAVAAKDCNKAVSSFSKAIDIDNNYLYAYLMRSFCYEQLGRYKDSLNDADTVISITSNQVTTNKVAESVRLSNQSSAYFQVAKTYYALKDYNQSAENSTKAIAIVSNNFAYYEVRGDAHHMLGLLEQAKQDYLSAFAVSGQEGSFGMYYLTVEDRNRINNKMTTVQHELSKP